MPQETVAKVNKPIAQPPVTSTRAPSPLPTRVAALDALRGFDMFWIVGGRELALATLALFPQPAPHWVDGARLQFEHTKWESVTAWRLFMRVDFTAWDLIMPLFLFVVGAAMPFSFARRAELGQSRSRMLLKLLRRSVILFIVGMAVQGHLLDFDLSTLHPFANTLQAIAVGYFIAGILMLTTPVWGQVAASIVLMLAYWLLLRFVPVPDHGAGVFEPHANVAYTVEQWVLGRFIDGTDPPYTYTWVLSGMTFTATVLLGVLAGHLLRSRFSPAMKLFWLTLLGLACLAGGWGWAEYGGFPIIKHIWTSSMVLWAAGWSYLLLAVFYLVMDVIGFRIWAFPFVVIGMNAITAYVAYHFIPFEKIAAGLVGGLARHLGAAGPFAIAFTTVLLVWLLLYHLFRHKVFLRI